MLSSLQLVLFYYPRPLNCFVRTHTHTQAGHHFFSALYRKTRHSFLRRRALGCASSTVGCLINGYVPAEEALARWSVFIRQPRVSRQGDPLYHLFGIHKGRRRDWRAKQRLMFETCDANFSPCDLILHQLFIILLPSYDSLYYLLFLSS